jgi:hypothetical protein
LADYAGLSEKQALRVFETIKDYFIDGLDAIVGEFKEVPMAVKKLMKKALEEVIEDKFYAMTGTTEERPDFIAMIPMFRTEVEKIMATDLMKLDFMNEQLLGEVG